jgi:hypothetical protein
MGTSCLCWRGKYKSVTNSNQVTRSNRKMVSDIIECKPHKKKY